MNDLFPPDRLNQMEMRARRRRALRMKQFTAILTTTGYATAAGGGWEPLLKHTGLDLVHALAFAFGVACLAAAIYFAAESEV